MFNKMKIKVKLLVIILVLTLIPLGVVSFLNYNQAQKALTQKSFDQLTSLRDVKKGQIESYFNERFGDLAFLSQSHIAVEGMEKFNEAYVTTGINSVEYANAEKEIGTLLTEYMNLYGYYDIFLINMEGDVVYTVGKEADFATNLVNGKYSDSGLATTFQKGKSETAIVDFEYYEASGEPASFMGTPVYDFNGKQTGVLAFQLSLDQINGIMQERSGLGESGETYLIGSDLLMRSDSRFSEESTVLSQKIETETARDAVGGATGAKIVDDYRGIPVFSAFTPLEINGLEWAMLAEIDEAEVNLPVKQMRNLVLIIAAVVLLVVVVSSIYFANMIAKPIAKMTKAAQKLAVGDTDVDVAVKLKDEIGTLSESFGMMVNNIQDQATALQNFADGDLGFDLQPKSENDTVSINLNGVKTKIEGFIEQAGQLSNVIEAGNLTEKLDTTGYDGCWRDILDNVNHIAGILEGHIKRVPAVMMAVDPEFNVIYMNDAGLGTVGANLEQAKGSKCYDLFKTGDCRTERCAVARAMRDGQNAKSETTAKPQGVQLEISYEGMPIKDSSGNILGAIELVTDQTDIKRGIRVQEKQAKFQANEVEKLIGNLEDLANGKLEIYTSVADTDADTSAIGQNFGNIYMSLTDMVNSIKSYITEASDMLAQMSNKNFDVEISREYKGDFVEMKNSINNIVDSFNGILSEINSSALQVSAGAVQVSQSAEFLSQGSTDQSSSIEEITTSMTEVAEQTRANAMNANKAKEVSNKVQENAGDGSKRMKEMLTAMKEINDSSSNIANIIKVIDEIAFQTNILALNAAVEAARAGEHGKGFAVVAEEVRNLAARSANAAKETTDMIENSINKVEAGTGIANATSEALDNIVTGIAEAANIVGNIANASTEQATAITQIDEGINQVSSVTQTNAATSEESAAASEEMASQADVLQKMVGSFRLRNQSNGRVGMSWNEPVKYSAKKESPKNEFEELRINLGNEDFGKY